MKSPADYLHVNIKVCSEHFEKSQYHPNSRRLRRDATPTLLDVPNPPKTHAVKRPLVVKQELPNKAPKKGSEAQSGPAEAHPCPEWSCDDVIFNVENVPPVELPAAAETPGQDKRMAAMINKYRCRISRQKRRIAELSERQKRECRKVDEAIETTSKILPAPIQSFLKSQLKAASVAPNGRRYTDENLMFALAIYYQGPRAYRFLRKRFFLPSPRLLRKRMEHIQTRSGFSDAIIAIMKEKLREAPAADKVCIITFDEMMLKTGLTYIRGDDMVEGFEDFGSLGRTSRPADHALVFMARGMGRKWKQPVFFSQRWAHHGSNNETAPHQVHIQGAGCWVRGGSYCL